MPYSFNPFTGKLSVVNPTAAALNVLGTVADFASLPGGATTGDVYQTLDTNDFYVWDGAAWDNLGDLAGPAGATGATGATGPAGADGADGVGVPAGGTAGQSLTKIDGTDYNTQWTTIEGNTDLTYTASSRLLESSTGDDVTLPLFDTASTDAGLVPGSNSAGANAYLDATGSWSTPAGGGGGGATPGGSDTQIQYNDGGTTFGGAIKLLYDDTTNAEKLTLDSADLVLDDGGSFTTSVQAITATANRVVSFPDATGTVALVPGADTQIAFNNSGVLDGNADFTRDATTGITYTPTWNDGATTFGAITVDVTDTASAAASTLLDLKVGGTSYTRISDTSFRVATRNTSATPTWEITPNGLSNSILTYTGTAGAISFSSGATITSGSDIKVNPGGGFPNFTIDNTSAYLGLGSLSVRLYGDADDTIAQRRATNPQTYRLYNTYTDASNYERLSTTWDTNVCYTKPENAGTGSARLYCPVTGATTVASLPSASTAGAGARSFVTDANSTTFLATAAGGGSNAVPVVSDGTNWLIG